MNRHYNENIINESAILDNIEQLLHQASTDDIEMYNISSTGSLPVSIQYSSNSAPPLEVYNLSKSPRSKYLKNRALSDNTSDDGKYGLQSKNSTLSCNEVFEIECTDEGAVDEKNTFSYANFLKAHTCYDCIPHSAKIVVVDAKIKVKKAFFALVHNGIRSAPVWDSELQEFVGMLTITDFITILIQYYKSPMVKMWELEEHRIETWRELFKGSLQNFLIRISPTESIYTAVKMLVFNKIHRLPVIDPDTGNALFILTHKKVLRFIYNHIDDLAMPDFLGSSLQELGIGSYNVIKIHPWTTVIEALHIFHQKRVSALPIVDEKNHCVDIYSKFDVINLAAERTYNNLDVTVQEALEHRQEGFEGVHKCLPTESLYVIIDRIANAQVHRLVVVDEFNKILGVVSLSDILRFIVLNPPKDFTPR
ncbi:5'-AMP-activated protein kinase subunit gamma-1-like isoform X1 [Hydra vulgaris]|uniref:5'-AMP-activated protein kinase subunit gamma-2 n=2 Tax=Hydra vulgaris TaxID=6087 RepID=T2M3A1_HYDVU|nr:5'-AMP-activated protein kinase subunit gamma-1-like [Hydra vulgaris]